MIVGAGHARDMCHARHDATGTARRVAGMARSYGKKTTPVNDRENGYA